jgi:hypothetical protein
MSIVLISSRSVCKHDGNDAVSGDILMKEKIELNQKQEDRISLKFLHWWFALSAPSQPASDASLASRESAGGINKS